MGGLPLYATVNTRMCRCPIQSLAPARWIFRRCTTPRATDRIMPAGSARRCCFRLSIPKIKNAKRDLKTRRECRQSAVPRDELFEGRFQKTKGESQTQAGFL